MNSATVLDYVPSEVVRPHARPSLSVAVRPGVTVLVPAYNEAASIGDTIESLLAQSLAPAEIIVIDDCSTDNTADVARAYGVTVLCPPANTGSKAGAQNYALAHVSTEFALALDGDTTVAPDAIEKLFAVMKDSDLAAACGFVVPRYVRTVWERGRYVEYLLAFSFYKPIQDYYSKPLISSGCFSIYRTEVLRQHGGWQTRTMAEDMDLTWTMYQAGQRVRFVPEAVCYPIEPHNFHFMSKQLRRWSHGFMQNVKLHWRRLVHIPYLRSVIGVALWESTVASVIYLGVLPITALMLRNPWILLIYILDAPALMAPVLTQAASRKEFWRALASIPAFFVLRVVNCVFVLEAIWSEFVLRKPLVIYEKGH
ncbi:MAG: glycosyltransferase family 2 protein [Acidobacteria bacterium]|nr:glycosyltransferase family 2 protein [Acidobacteriota bacterium]